MWIFVRFGFYAALKALAIPLTVSLDHFKTNNKGDLECQNQSVH